MLHDLRNPGFYCGRHKDQAAASARSGAAPQLRSNFWQPLKSFNKSFDKFRSLPTEFRLTIWEMNFPEPRLVEPCEIDRYTEYMRSREQGCEDHEVAAQVGSNEYGTNTAPHDDLDSGLDSDDSGSSSQEDFALRVICSLPGLLALQVNNDPKDWKSSWQCISCACTDITSRRIVNC